MNVPTNLPDPVETPYPDYTGQSDTKIMLLRWQDNRSEKWSKAKPISLGKIGESFSVRRLSPMGTYRSRQFEFVISDPVIMLIGSIEDDNGVL